MIKVWLQDSPMQLDQGQNNFLLKHTSREKKRKLQGNKYNELPTISHQTLVQEFKNTRKVQEKYHLYCDWFTMRNL